MHVDLFAREVIIECVHLRTIRCKLLCTTFSSCVFEI